MFAVALDAVLSPDGWSVAVGDDGVLCELGELVYRAPLFWAGWDIEEQGRLGGLVGEALRRAAEERVRGLVRVAVTAGPHGWSATVVR